MTAEMQRAMSSLGSVAAATSKVPAIKPYFVSYSVADNQNVTITAQFGALTNSSATHNRVADVQVRLGTPGLDNTHGDHRTSALTTMPLPLGDNRAAIERALWLATNRGYGKALDALEKVKTEQQVRAKEEDTSADFSAQKPHRRCARFGDAARGRSHSVGRSPARHQCGLSRSREHPLRHGDSAGRA